MNTSNLPSIQLTGRSLQQAQDYGAQLKKHIANSITFYNKLFASYGLCMMQEGAKYAKTIAEQTPAHAKQIIATARAAGAHPFELMAVNARTEIRSLRHNECTSAAFTDAGLIGQTWDWGGPQEKAIGLLRIEEPDGHKILTMTEGGMLGKIGFNNAGIGVCLNALSCKQQLKGTPIHLVLRKLLEARTREEALETIQKHGKQTAGNILLHLPGGEIKDFELANGRIFELEAEERIYVHTNHYLGADINNPRAPSLQSSYARHARGQQLAKELRGRTVKDFKRLLADQEHETHPIQRPFKTHKTMQYYGTVSSIIMHPEKQEMHITPGNPIDNDYMKVRL